MKTKHKKILIIIIAVMIILSLATIKKEKLDSTYMLQASNADLSPYDGEIIHITGYTIRYLRLYFARGTVTIGDSPWTIRRYKYSFQSSAHTMKLVTWDSLGSAEIVFSDSDAYPVRVHIAGYPMYEAVPLQ